MAEHVILVDADDRQVGLEEKVRCHLPDGRLHRAFTALLFDVGGGELMLARRSPSKMLWPGSWDGTFASHPREGETYASSSERRMPEELGLRCGMEYLFKFEYHAPYKDVGSENEICGTVMGTVDRGAGFEPAAGEISEIRWVSPGELAEDMGRSPADYCPWMLIALHLLDASGPKAAGRHGGILRRWATPEVKARAGEAAAAHLPESRWRLAGCA